MSPLFSSNEHPRKSKWVYLWQSADIRQKILITLLLVAIYRFLLNIPVPGIISTPDSIRENIVPGSGLYTMLDFLSMLSGSSLLGVSVLALGLLPFNLSGLLLKLTIPLIPSLQMMFEDDPRGSQRWFERWNYYLAVPVAIFEAFLFLFLISPNCEGKLFLLDGGSKQSGLLFMIAAITILVAGSFLAVWFAGLISEYGIRGQGNSILIMSGIIGGVSNEFARLVYAPSTDEGNLLPAFSQRILHLGNEPLTLIKLISYIVLFVLCILIVVYLQGGRRNIPVLYPGRRVGSRMSMPIKGNLPLQLTIGSDGLIGSQLLVALTTFYAPLISCSSNAAVNTGALWIINIFGGDSPSFAIITFISVVTFTYFYTGITFQQQNYAENLWRTGARIPGVNTQNATQKYLEIVQRRITLPSALGLGLLTIAPWMFNLFLVNVGSESVTLSLLDAEKILIMVGVIRDIFLNLGAELHLHGYQESILMR